MKEKVVKQTVHGATNLFKMIKIEHIKDDKMILHWYKYQNILRILKEVGLSNVELIFWFEFQKKIF